MRWQRARWLAPLWGTLQRDVDPLFDTTSRAVAEQIQQTMEAANKNPVLTQQHHHATGSLDDR